MKVLIDGILEKDVIDSLIKSAAKEKESDDGRIVDYNNRIAILDRQLNRPDIRDSAKRDIRGWLGHYKNERLNIIKKHSLYE
jgi:hypothetical protein